MDIPKAPGNGLMLERLHYDLYELRYCGEDEKFRREVIFEQMLTDEIDDGS
jgi:hypothetical protein